MKITVRHLRPGDPGPYWMDWAYMNHIFDSDAIDLFYKRDYSAVNIIHYDRLSFVHLHFMDRDGYDFRTHEYEWDKYIKRILHIDEMKFRWQDEGF